jgi:site-specific DNA recombinase
MSSRLAILGRLGRSLGQAQASAKSESDRIPFCHAVPPQGDGEIRFRPSAGCPGAAARDGHLLRLIALRSRGCAHSRLLIDEQLSAYQIGERLYESGIRTRHGKERWGSGTLINLMRNPVYTGLYHYNKRQHVPAKRRNMPGDGLTRKHNSSRVIRPKEEWIPIEVPAIIDQETWDQAREQLQRNKERAPRNNKKHDYLLKGLLVCGRCQLRMHGHAGDPVKRNRRYLCSHKESHHAGAKCLNRTVQADTIEELVWQAVSELLRNPQVLIEQYNQRHESGYGTPEQQEQQRLKRRLVKLERESQRLIDAYQSGVIELGELKVRRERIAEECRRLEERLSSLEQQRQGQQRQAALATTVEEFCRNISAALDNPSFETKQKILRLVVERVEFVEDQITIKHVIPISDVRLQRDQQVTEMPYKTRISTFYTAHGRRICS